MLFKELCNCLNLKNTKTTNNKVLKIRKGEKYQNDVGLVIM